MSRFLPENHPQQGKCDFCPVFGRLPVGKTKLLVADFKVDAMIVCGSLRAGTIGQSGVVTLTITQRLCRACHRDITKGGTPQVHLASRGFQKRLTRKQTEKAARKIARDLKKMQDDS